MATSASDLSPATRIAIVSRDYGVLEVGTIREISDDHVVALKDDHGTTSTWRLANAGIEPYATGIWNSTHSTWLVEDEHDLAELRRRFPNHVATSPCPERTAFDAYASGRGLPATSYATP